MATKGYILYELKMVSPMRPCHVAANKADTSLPVNMHQWPSICLKTLCSGLKVGPVVMLKSDVRADHAESIEFLRPLEIAEGEPEEDKSSLRFRRVTFSPTMRSLLCLCFVLPCYVHAQLSFTGPTPATSIGKPNTFIVQAGQSYASLLLASGTPNSTVHDRKCCGCLGSLQSVPEGGE